MSSGLLFIPALRIPAFIFVFAALLLTRPDMAAADIDCLKCHGNLAEEKIQHPAIAMGCPTCHTDIDASTVPHKKTGKIDKGLSAEQPELCYGCHDKSLFSKKTVHAAVGMGCTGCHNPHSSKNEKLLVTAQPELCYGCHDKSLFTKKNVHAPVAGGMCLACHTPHSSENMALLNQEPIKVCLACHGDVEKKPHAIRGIAGAGHPLGKKDKKDPKRPEKKFYCGSCHNPHSSDSMRLFRYPAKAVMGICVNCHKF